MRTLLYALGFVLAQTMPCNAGFIVTRQNAQYVIQNNAIPTGKLDLSIPISSSHISGLDNMLRSSGSSTIVSSLTVLGEGIALNESALTVQRTDGAPALATLMNLSTAVGNLARLDITAVHDYMDENLGSTEVYGYAQLHINSLGQNTSYDVYLGMDPYDHNFKIADMPQFEDDFDGVTRTAFTANFNDHFSGIYMTTPTATLDVGGNALVRSTFTATGPSFLSTTTINGPLTVGGTTFASVASTVDQLGVSTSSLHIVSTMSFGPVSNATNLYVGVATVTVSLPVAVPIFVAYTGACSATTGETLLNVAIDGVVQVTDADAILYTVSSNVAESFAFSNASFYWVSPVVLSTGAHTVSLLIKSAGTAYCGTSSGMTLKNYFSAGGL